MSTHTITEATTCAECDIPIVDVDGHARWHAELHTEASGRSRINAPALLAATAGLILVGILIGIPAILAFTTR